MTGVWVSERRGEEMRLELRKGGTFVKTTKMEFPSSGKPVRPRTLTIRQIGKYKIEDEEIVFYDFREGLAGKEFTHIKGSIRIPYSKEDELLIWNPRTAKKRAFLRKS
ncbi:MAG TPA: hypothetical protein VNK96_09555 [Fimbriimonadales bacterium]|nr:hypothetical protein [Fimbriimonadales bacterium]